MAQLLGVDEAKIQTGLSTFQGIPHRMEWIASIGGVDCYNDSKATNVGASLAALQRFDRPIVWIAGGQDKGNDYALLQPVVQKHVKAMICLGKDNAPISQAFQHTVTSIYATQQMEEAVRQALDWAVPGDIVLLSPACASFDLFKNFEERGECFRKAVFGHQ